MELDALRKPSGKKKRRKKLQPIILRGDARDGTSTRLRIKEQKKKMVRY